MRIQAIETKYKGHRFRSKLEAKWAVFLDHMGVCWDYEPQGFHLGRAGNYLPDFFLPFPQPVDDHNKPDSPPWSGWRDVQAYWLEIKPFAPKPREISVALALAAHTQHHVYCFAGKPWPGEFEVFLYTIKGHSSSLTARWKLDHLYGFYCNVCPHLEYPGLAEVEQSAFAAARSSRFELGESPVPVVVKPRSSPPARVKTVSDSEVAFFSFQGWFTPEIWGRIQVAVGGILAMQLARAGAPLIYANGHFVFVFPETHARELEACNRPDAAARIERALNQFVNAGRSITVSFVSEYQS